MQFARGSLQKPQTHFIRQIRVKTSSLQRQDLRPAVRPTWLTSDPVDTKATCGTGAYLYEFSVCICLGNP
jgi:hypothetical protein